jgi:hypothetical protein
VHNPDTAGDATLKSQAAKSRLDERLDEALTETFPASDPVAVHEPLLEQDLPDD